MVHPMPVEKGRVLPLQLGADSRIVEVDELTTRKVFDPRRRPESFAAPAGRHSGRWEDRIAAVDGGQSAELGQGFGVRPEVGESLAEGSNSLARAVEDAEASAGIVEPVGPAAAIPGRELPRAGDVAHSPHPARRLQPATSTKAYAAGMIRRSSSGLVPWRRRYAGASSSSRVLEPKNQARAVSSS
jgi:hypothetical protein